MFLTKVPLWWTCDLRRKEPSFLPLLTHHESHVALMAKQAPRLRRPLFHWQHGSNKETKPALTNSLTLVGNKSTGYSPDSVPTPQTGTASKDKTVGAGFSFLPDAQLKGWCQLILFVNIQHLKLALWWIWHVTVKEAGPLPWGIRSGLELDPM